jgi:hypothetical protein
VVGIAQINGMPVPFLMTENIRMLIVFLPNSQLVRSIVRTRGFDRNLPFDEWTKTFGTEQLTGAPSTARRTMSASSR